MIFYTLSGPKHRLEIHDDKIRLTTRTWWTLWLKKQETFSWELHDLASFEVSVPKTFLWGKVEWRSFDGRKGSLRFSSHPTMVSKIEKYLQKRVYKNHQRSQLLVA